MIKVFKNFIAKEEIDDDLSFITQNIELLIEFSA